MSGLDATDRVPRSSSTLIGTDEDSAAVASRLKMVGVIATFSVRLSPNMIGMCFGGSSPHAAPHTANTSAAASGSTVMFHSATGVVLPR